MAPKYRFNGFTAGRQKPLNRSGPDWIGHCQLHDKTAWVSRKAARRALRKRHPEGGKSPYRCPHTNGWHYGTLHFSRDTYRGLADGCQDGHGNVDERSDEREQSRQQPRPAQAP